VNAALATVVIVAGSTALRVVYDPKVSDKPGALFKVAVAAFALGALLSLVAGSAPGLADVLGVTLVIASLMLNGNAVLTATGHVFGGK
jgi:hypothetical protein